MLILKSDIPTKRMLQIRTEDWISFAFPELTNINVRDMQSDMVARIKQESLLDNVKWVNSNTIAHLEPMLRT